MGRVSGKIESENLEVLNEARKGDESIATILALTYVRQGEILDKLQHLEAQGWKG